MAYQKKEKEKKTEEKHT